MGQKLLEYQEKNYICRQCTRDSHSSTCELRQQQQETELPAAQPGSLHHPRPGDKVAVPVGRFQACSALDVALRTFN